MPACFCPAGPGVKDISAKLYPPTPGSAAAACGARTWAVVSAPSPASVGVKLPCPKYGKTALPVISIACGPNGVPTVTRWPTRRPSWRSTEVPSTISWSVRGGRPSSTVADSMGPVPPARPIAGIAAAAAPPGPFTETVPCTPKVTMASPRTCPVY
jgi:hypothetical protein